MAIKLVGQKTKVWTYRMSGIVPTNPELSQPGVMEAAVRAAVSWNDTMLSFIRGSDVTVEELTDEQVAGLMRDFEKRLSGH